MEKPRIWQLLPLMLGLAGFIGLAGCSGETSSKNVLNGSLTMNQEKIDPALSLAIQNSELTKQPMQLVDVLIRTRGEVDATQRAALERQGARIGSVMGDVLTASVPTQAIPEIANLEFVVHIEMSKQQRLR